MTREKAKNEAQVWITLKPSPKHLILCGGSKGWCNPHQIPKMKTGRCMLTGVVSASCPSGWRLAWSLSQFPPWLMHLFRWTVIFSSSRLTNPLTSKNNAGEQGLFPNCKKGTEMTPSLNTVSECRLPIVSYEDSNFQHCLCLMVF